MKKRAIMVSKEFSGFNYVEICKHLDISENQLIDFLEYGLLEESTIILEEFIFTEQAYDRLQKATRLHKDLGINIPGVVLALELSDELERMRAELSILQRHLNSD